MRALLFCLIGLTAASLSPALAQMKLSPKAAPGASETRYFTSIDGLMDGNADVILKETRQGKTVTAAVLDVCYPAEKGSERKDRFVANLAVNGQNLTGTTQSIGDKLPVTVKLVRKPTGDSFEFKGQIGVGQTVTEVSSSDNSDLSEQEFKDNQSTDDSIAAAPKDFTEVSPEAVAVRVKLDAALDFLKSLKGQPVEVSLSSLAVSCDALRAGEQTITISVDPDRAAALIAKAKSSPGVVAAGWTAGVVDMERAIRFPAAEWRDGDKLNRDKLATGHRRRDRQNDVGETGFLAMEREYRQAETDVQAPEPGLSRARTHRHHRSRGAGFFRQARRVRPPDALGRQPLHHHRGRGGGREAQSGRGRRHATRKASRPTTTARSMRWQRNSRASAGTPTNRPGNSVVPRTQRSA